MPKIVLPPDAFDELPDEYGWTAEAEGCFPDPPEYDDYRDRCELDARYDAEERFAELFEMRERGAA